MSSDTNENNSAPVVRMTIDRYGAIVMEKGLTVSGNTIISGTTLISGATTLSSTLNVAGNIRGSRLEIDGATEYIDKSFAGDLFLVSTANVAIQPGTGKALAVDGNLGISGNTILGNAASDTLTVAAASTFNNNITITGNTYISGNTEFGGTLTVAGVTDLNGNVDIDNATTTIDSSSTISLDAAGASNFTTSAGDLTLAATAAGADVIINGNGNASSKVDVNAGNFDVDATSTNITNSSHTTINNTGGNMSILNSGGPIALDASTTMTIDSVGTMTFGSWSPMAIDMNATTFDLDATGALTIDSATSIAIGAAADKPIDIDSTTLDIDASGALTIDSATSIAIGTNGNVDVTIGTNSSTVTIGDNMTVTDDLRVEGNLTIIGSATTVTFESEILRIADNIIDLNSNITGATTPTENAGINIMRGSGTTASLYWDEGADKWTISGTTSASALITESTSGVPVISNKNHVPTSTTGGATGTTGVIISGTPTNSSYVSVYVNGLKSSIGDAIKTKEFYFSSDSGVTPKSISTIAASDTLFAGTGLTYNLDSSDLIDLEYVNADTTP